MSRLYTIIARHFKITNAEAELFITERQVLVNGKKAPPSQKLEYWDEVSYDGFIIRPGQKFVYLKFYKPVGIESSKGKTIENNLRSAVNHPAEWQPVGRLDKESEGLMLLTDDGRIARAVSDSRTHQEKEYLVKLDRDFDEDFLQRMREGVFIMGKKTRPAQVWREGDRSDTFRIILTQGLNRQIRRMCYQLNYKVEKLKRVRIASLLLDGLQAGEWRELSDEERETLLKIAGIPSR